MKPQTAVRNDRFGLGALTALVLGTMIGGGIFNIAQTMSATASLGAALVAWGITGAGVILLVLTFKILSDRRPHLDKGIYQYAQEVGGDYMGFNVAWGYWLSVTVSLVAYAVMLNDSMGAFFPTLLNHGWPTVVFGLCLIWLMCLIVMCGVKGAAILNSAMTVLKFALLAFIIVVLVIYAKVGAMRADFWGAALHIGRVGEQVRSDMMISLWCFIGIEGAVMMSARAKRKSDVGKASIMGFLLALTLYILVSALCFGIMSQPQLSKLPNPSMAYVLRAVCGDWAYYFVVVSVMLSILGSWVAWTMVCAQAPFGAASAKIMPVWFMQLSSKGVPWFSLMASSTFMTIFLILVCMSSSLFMAAVRLTAVMVLPAYFFSAVYLFKISWGPGARQTSPGFRLYVRTVGVLCTLFTLWMLWAGGLSLLLMSSVFYLAGAWFYIQARRQHFPDRGRTFGQIMTRRDKWIFALLCCASVATLVMVATGNSPL